MWTQRLELGLRAGLIRRIIQGFFTFETSKVFWPLAMWPHRDHPLDQIRCKQLNTIRSGPRGLLASCSHWWFYNLPSRDDECLSAWTVDYTRHRPVSAMAAGSRHSTLSMYM